MPILGSLFVTLVSGLAGFLGRFMSFKVAVSAAALLAFGTLTVGLYTLLAGLSAGITATFPAMALTGVWLFVPDNTVACITIIATTDAACALYRWNLEALRLGAYAG